MRVRKARGFYTSITTEICGPKEVQSGTFAVAVGITVSKATVCAARRSYLKFEKYYRTLTGAQRTRI